MLRKLKGLLVGLFLGFGGFALAQITIGLQGSQDTRLNLGVDGSRNFYMLSIQKLFNTPVTAPSASSCGTNPTVTGSDWQGVISEGTGAVTSCILTFNSAFTTAPQCVVSSQSVSNVIISWATTTTNLTITKNANGTSNKDVYICISSS